MTKARNVSIVLIILVVAVIWFNLPAKASAPVEAAAETVSELGGGGSSFKKIWYNAENVRPGTSTGGSTTTGSSTTASSSTTMQMIQMGDRLTIHDPVGREFQRYGVSQVPVYEANQTPVASTTSGISLAEHRFRVQNLP